VFAESINFFVKDKEVYSILQEINGFMLYFNYPFCYSKTIFTNLDFNSTEVVCDSV